MNGRISRALAFLAKKQLPSGEFRLASGADRTLRESSAPKTTFGTAMIARTLLSHRHLPGVSSMLDRARDFLLRERDHDGLWRFFGRGSDLVPDADDTACALLAFDPEHGDRTILEQVVRNADLSGAALTWFPDADGVPPAVNEADPVVNANVYLLCRSRAFEAPSIRSYLERLIATGDGPSRYYPSPFFFAYVIAGSELAARQLEAAVLGRIELAFDDVLQTALALGALSRCGSAAPVQRRLLESILDAQAEDGGWPACSAFVEPRMEGPIFYGSRELTTSLCIDALHRECDS
jgi:hypothetical protein